MNSREKVAVALDRVAALADDQTVTMDLQIAGGMVVMARPLIEKFIPEDARDLDQLLDRGAEWMNSLKSDVVAELTE